MFMLGDCLDWRTRLVCCFKLAGSIQEFVDYASRPAFLKRNPVGDGVDKGWS